MTENDRRTDADHDDIEEEEEWDDDEDDEDDDDLPVSSHVAREFSQFLVQGPLMGSMFPFIVVFAVLMQILLWPWSRMAGWLISRPPHLIQPYLLFRCIVRSMKQFGSHTDHLSRLADGGTAAERRALRVLPLMVLSDLDLAGFRRVILGRAPFTLHHVGRKKLRVQVGEGEPLSRGEQVLILSFVSLIPLAILLAVLSALLGAA